MPDEENKQSAPAKPLDPDNVRMSFGDHLDELRRYIIRSLIGVLVASILSLLFVKHLLVIVLHPAVVVLRHHGQDPTLMALSPQDPFIIYLKIGLLVGIIVSSPWVMWQLWKFVATGLYEREQRFVRLFAPISIVLFVTGVVFMFAIVLPIVLNFFVTFSSHFPMPDVMPTTFERLLLGKEEPAETTTQPAGPPISVLPTDPNNPPKWVPWYNSSTHELCIETEEGLYSLQLKPRERKSALSNQFGLNFYVSFVLALSFAFGVAFEMPIVVIFLAMTGIVKVSAMGKARRYVLLGIVVLAAFLTPPDVMSQMLLAVPMYGLFEIGLLFAKIIEKRRQKAQPPDA